MTPPSICTYVLLFKMKCAYLVQRYNNSFISCFCMLVLISFLSYIILIIILIVSSKGTLVNGDTKSNNTIWYPGGIFCFFSAFINDILLLVVYCDWPRGVNIWAKYFPSLYVAVLMFEIIGLSGASYTVPLSLTLCSLVVQ